MDLSDLQKKLNAANEAIHTAQAEATRLNQEAMTLMGVWLDAQVAAENAYGSLSRKQTEQGRAIMQLSQAKRALLFLWEQVQVESVRRSAQA